MTKIFEQGSANAEYPVVYPEEVLEVLEEAKKEFPTRESVLKEISKTCRPLHRPSELYIARLIEVRRDAWAEKWLFGVTVHMLPSPERS